MTAETTETAMLKARRFAGILSSESSGVMATMRQNSRWALSGMASYGYGEPEEPADDPMLEEFKAMRRRRMNTACASVGGYMITEHDWHLDLCKRWLEGQPLKLCASGNGYLGNAVETKALGAFLYKCLGHHDSLITML